MYGMLTYVADEARFTECLTGRDYPLVRGDDYEALEHAYLAAGAGAAGPIMASFQGRIGQQPAEDGDGTVPGVLVERFIGVWPGETCERTVDAPTLTNTYWKILRLGDAEVAASADRREPNLVLRADAARYAATVGCNQLVGDYTLGDDKLAFSVGATTRMACPPPLDDWERRLARVLERTAGWRIDGQTLELLDAEGEPLALLQAVYLY
jgi:heat shock protein HslJ